MSSPAWSSMFPLVFGDASFQLHIPNFWLTILVPGLFFLVLLILVLILYHLRVVEVIRRLRRSIGVLSGVGVRVAVVDADGNYLFCHYRGGRFAPERALYGTRNNPELLPENREITSEVLAQNMPRQVDFSIEGDFFRAEVFPLPESVYRVPCAVWTVYNVTDLHVAREEFSEYARWLTSTLDEISEGIVVLDEKSNVS